MIAFIFVSGLLPDLVPFTSTNFVFQNWIFEDCDLEYYFLFFVTIKMILLNHRPLPYFKKYYCEKQTIRGNFKCDINHQNMLLFLELLHVSKS